MRSRTQVTWPEKVKDLPRTLDRFRAASVFFDIKYPVFLRASTDVRKWTSWASLSAIASIPEVAEYDFEDAGLLEKWRQSLELKEIRNNKVLAVLRELRNYEMHIEYQTRKASFEIDRAAIQEAIDHDSFFFSPIDWVKFQKLRNIRSGRSTVDQAAILSFNNYASLYSVETIVSETLELLADKIYCFLKRQT